MGSALKCEQQPKRTVVLRKPTTTQKNKRERERERENFFVFFIYFEKMQSKCTGCYMATEFPIPGNRG